MRKVLSRARGEKDPGKRKHKDTSQKDSDEFSKARRLVQGYCHHSDKK